MDKAEAFACAAVFLPKHLNDTDHFGIEADCAWDLASVLSRMLRRGLSFMGIWLAAWNPWQADVTETFTEDKEAAARPRFMNLSSVSIGACGLSFP